LAENKAHIVYSTSDRTKGKLSRTGYRVLKQTKDFALLELDLLTGRKHQIRVHLAGMGHPVVGDRKYGKEDRDHTRLALHARSISFKHPFTGQQLTFESQVPAYFNQLVGKVELKDGPD
jgi:tRNA pseudouridine32 synthase/23S rRNA pseudouridine746 synthase/23S rRNA pseudouridine1911/1915/1917 synthase